MQTIQYNNLTQHGAEALQIAVNTILAVDPIAHQRLFNVCQWIIVDPNRCGNRAWACVQTNALHVIYLAIAPEHIAMGKLAELLRHEAQHVFVDANGRRILIPHTCRDGGCQVPAERASDPIYAGDAEIRPWLDAHLRSQGWNPDRAYVEPTLQPVARPAPVVRDVSPWLVVAIVAGVAAAAVAMLD